MNIIIAGGTGLIGRRLTDSFRANGHKITIISRKENSNTISWNQVKKNGIPDKTDAIINLTGRNVGDLEPSQFLGGYQKFLDEVRQSRIETTKLLSNIIKDNNSVKYYVNASAVGIYEPSDSTVYAEDSVLQHKSYFSKLCRDWEASIDSSNPSTKYFAFRIGVVLDKESPVLKQLYLPFKLGFGGPVGDGKQWFPWINMKDMVGLFNHVIDGKFDSAFKDWKKTEPYPVNCVSPNPIKYQEFTQALGIALNAPVVNKFTTPGIVMKLLMGNERAELILKGPNVYPKNALANNYKFKHDNITDALQDIYN